jgi:hypothetical protein
MDPAELQQQLAALMKVVTEERQLRQEAEVARQRAEARLAKQTVKTNAQSQPLTTPTAPARGPKIAAPDKFDGLSRAKAKVYGSQVGLYVVSKPTLFPDNISKVAFVLSYLTGAASVWAQRFTQQVFTGDPVTYNEFTVAFQAMYFNTEKKSLAEKALRALKQTKSVAAYTHTFMIHAHDCGWEAGTLVSQYAQGSHKDIRLALVLARMTFETLAAVLQLALKIDNEINGANSSITTSAAAQADPTAMDISAVNARMSDAEKARMMKQGLCFRCEEHGHLARDCPTKGTPRNQDGTTRGQGRGKGREKVKINALEEEIKRLTAKLKMEGSGGNNSNSKNGDAQA